MEGDSISTAEDMIYTTALMYSDFPAVIRTIGDSSLSLDVFDDEGGVIVVTTVYTDPNLRWTPDPYEFPESIRKYLRRVNLTTTGPIDEKGYE